MKNVFSQAQAATVPPEPVHAKTWLAIWIALGFALALLAAAAAPAEEPDVVAQAASPKPKAAPDASAQPAPAGGSTAKPAAPSGVIAPPSGIEEIVVKGAESDAANDFENADSVTGFGAEDLAALGANNIADLAAFTPNLEIVTGGATTPTFFIRGVGLNDFNSNSTGSVAIYQDDVPINAPALQLATLYDTEAVNVLRGPQGTGLARNASAGAIKIYSRKPTGEFSGFLRSEFGNFNARDFEGAFEAPIYEDVVAGRFAFRFTERDGTMQNRCGNAPTYLDRTPVPDATTLRLAGRLTTDAPWSMCGEPVDINFDPDRNDILGTNGPLPPGRSYIPENLAGSVNNQNNWATRGTLLIQPTLDMSWLVNMHGARRDELSRLGQSMGTRGYTCANGDVTNCGILGNTGDTGESLILGVLGGEQGIAAESYVSPDIQTRLRELAPCAAGVPLFPGTTACERGSNNPLIQPQTLAQFNAAKIKLGKELANHLDSEPWKGEFNMTGPTRNDTYGGYLKGDMALPGGVQLSTITGYDHYNRFINIDLDFSPETLFQIKTDDDGWQVTQGLQLQGQLGYESPVRWDIGGWFLKEQLNVVVTNDLGPFSVFGVGARDYTQDLWSLGTYASLAFDFWDDFTLDGGVRYNAEEKKLDYGLDLPSSNTLVTQKLNDLWQAPTGTIRLTYRFREDTHAYWKYTRGWKPGSYNATSSPYTGVTTADPETIDAFETGLRGAWFDGRLGLDASLFYYSYKNYQIFTAQQFAGGQPEFVILNADHAEVYGAELDAVARPWSGAFANVRFGWLESQFLDFVQIQQVIEIQNGTQVIVNKEINNTGNPLLNSPRFKVSLTGEQTLPIGRFGSLTARYDGVWTDTSYYGASKGLGIPNDQDIFFLPKNTIAQPAFWLHNIRLAYRPPGGHIEVAGWVRNIANTPYKTYAFDASTFNSTSIYFVGDPRTFGATITVTF